MKNKKSLGQHWLKDRATLTKIAEYAKLESQPPDRGTEEGVSLGCSHLVNKTESPETLNTRPDGLPEFDNNKDKKPVKPDAENLSRTTRFYDDDRAGKPAKKHKNEQTTPLILEIGPGLGTLTSVLLKLYDKVTAIEFDANLAKNLPNSFPGKDLKVINTDILDFDLSQIKQPYVVIGNIPYYITSPIIKKFLKSENKPQKAVFLVQKEVADRAAAGKGKHTILSLETQARAKVSTGIEVKKSLFVPPPKVDSKVLILEPYDAPKITEEALSLAKLGFSSPRKKLAHNLSAALKKPRTEIESALESLKISPDVRPAVLDLQDWQNLSKTLA
jgi:16S rRNA (adenine1518-N6/adenine1519-N6)-dimethyltransferase